MHAYGRREPRSRHCRVLTPRRGGWNGRAVGFLMMRPGMTIRFAGGRVVPGNRRRPNFPVPSPPPRWGSREQKESPWPSSAYGHLRSDSSSGSAPGSITPSHRYPGTWHPRNRSISACNSPTAGKPQTSATGLRQPPAPSPMWRCCRSAWVAAGVTGAGVTGCGRCRRPAGSSRFSRLPCRRTSTASLPSSRNCRHSRPQAATPTRG